MKRVLALGAVAAVFAAPASAATPNQRIAALEQQVKVLQGSVKKLQTQVKTLQNRERFDRNEIAANYEGDACLAASMADLVQSTWTALDQGSSSPKFGAQQQVDDRGACAGIGVTRHGIKTPPVVTAVTALIAWIIG